MDEPTASLDPEIAVKVRQFLVRQQEQYKVAILFTSHNMHEVQEICDRIIFLKKGRIIAQDKPLDLVGRLKKTELRLHVTINQAIFEKYLKMKKITYTYQKGKHIITLKEDEIAKLLFRLSEKGVRYEDLEVRRPTLEDYFIRLAENPQKGGLK